MKKLRFLVCLLLVMLLTACTGREEEEPVTTDFAEDTVFTVGEERVSLGEWYLYALPKISTTESMYGADIWDYQVDLQGHLMAEKIRDEIRDEITYVKIVSAQAQRLGIGLNEDELMDVGFETEGYMEKLPDSYKAAYGITSEVVSKVYADNLLAMKVYENLTLNIDTTIPDEQVRHMVLQYISILKSYEDENGEVQYYSSSEIAGLKARAEDFLAEVKSNPDIKLLSEAEAGDYAPIEITAGYADLCDALPEGLPGIAFSLQQDEISGLHETADAFFILNCVNRNDVESTNAARIEIIEERQRTLFENEYTLWSHNVVIKYNYDIWDSIKVGEMP